MAKAPVEAPETPREDAPPKIVWDDSKMNTSYANVCNVLGTREEVMLLFGAIATAYGLTGSSLNIVTILLYAQIRGDVLHNQNLGYALALGMILITGLSNGAYIWLRSRSERWMR